MLPKMTETDGPSDVSYKIPTHADFMIAYSTIPGVIINASLLVLFLLRNFVS